MDNKDITITAGTITGSVFSGGYSLEETVRRIVREEIAAHEERPIPRENVTLGESNNLSWDIG